jgi:hypothetical protein
VWAGVAGDPGLPVRLGVGLEAAAPALLTRLASRGRLGAADLRVAGLWAPAAWELGPAAGISLRFTADPRGETAVGPQALLGATLARRVSVGPVAIRLALLVERDLVPSILLDADGGAHRLQPVSASLSVGLWTR